MPREHLIHGLPVVQCEPCATSFSYAILRTTMAPARAGSHFGAVEMESECGERERDSRWMLACVGGEGAGMREVRVKSRS